MRPGFNPLRVGAWAATGELPAGSPNLLVFQSPESRGVGCNFWREIDEDLEAVLFQSPESRGVGCNPLSRGRANSGGRCFNPLRVGAWAATKKHRLISGINSNVSIP